MPETRTTTTTPTRTDTPVRERPLVDPEPYRSPDTICPQQRKEMGWDF